MARVTKATPARRSAKTAEPKKKIGRPLGSKNKVVASAKSKASPASRTPATRRATAAAPSPVRMNKAELETHVIKLERSLARARTQTAELKKALKEAQQPPAAKAAEPSAPAKESSGSLVKRARRPEPANAASEQGESIEVDQLEE